MRKGRVDFRKGRDIYRWNRVRDARTFMNQISRRRAENSAFSLVPLRSRNYLSRGHADNSATQGPNANTKRKLFS